MNTPEIDEANRPTMRHPAHLASPRARAEALWARLRTHDAGMATAPPADDDTPWYLAALLGIAAWVAAGFLLGFFFVLFDDLYAQAALAGTLGAICCTAALGLMRYARGREFAEQFATAISLAGQLLCALAVYDLLDRRLDDQTGVCLVWCTVAVLGLTMAVLGPATIHRFLSAALAAVGVALALSFEPSLAGRAAAAPVLAAAAVALWWASERGMPRIAIPLLASTGLSPMAWAFTLVAIVLQWIGPELYAGVDLVAQTAETARIWHLAASLATVAVLPLCVAWLARASAQRWRWVAVSAALALAMLGAPGVAFGSALVLLGFGLHRPALLGVGALALAVYLFRYYYQLEITLLQKSGWLLAAGAALLLLRADWRRHAPKEAA